MEVIRHEDIGIQAKGMLMVKVMQSCQKFVAQGGVVKEFNAMISS